MRETRILIVAFFLFLAILTAAVLVEKFPRIAASGADYISETFRGWFETPEDSPDIYQNPEITDQLIERAQDGDIEAQYELGVAYATIASDEIGLLDEKAVYWLRTAAEGGHVLAQNEIGYIYRKGLHGESTDIQAALDWLYSAAEQGDELAHANIAQILRDGVGVERDDETATEYFRLSADMGYPPAQFEFGARLSEGVGISKDFTIGRRWIVKARLNDFGTQEFLVDELTIGDNLLGSVMLLVGIEARVSRNATTWADETYALASSAKQPTDIFLMDIAWDDPEVRHKLFRGAALLGHRGAQYELGRRFQSGHGVDQDAAEARYWFGRAAAQGYEKAIEAMRADSDQINDLP